VLPNGNRQRRTNISWKSFAVSVQPAHERPNQVEDDRAHYNGRKVPQRPSESSCDRRALFPEVIAEVIQCSRVKHQRSRHDNHGQKNIQGKLPDLCLRDEQPRRKQPPQNRVQEELQQPKPATSQTASKNETWFLKM